MSRTRRLAWAGLSLLVAAPTPVALAGPPDAREPGIESATFAAAVFSPDGRLVLTGSGNVVLAWDARTGRPIRRFVGHEETVFAVSFSPDGKRAATGAGRTSDMGDNSVDSTARIWDVATGMELHRLPHDDIVFNVAFGPDGRQLLTATRSNFRLWDAAIRDVFVRRPAYTTASFSPDGHSVLTSGERYELANGAAAEGAPGAGKAQARLVSYGVIWDAATGKELIRFEGHTGEVVAQHFSPDGKVVVTASRDGTARTWDATTGRSLRVFRGHQGVVHDAIFGPGGGRLVTASSDKTVRLWDAERGTELRRFPTPGEAFKASVGGNGGRVLATWARVDDMNRPSQHASLWDIETSREMKRYTLQDGSSVALFSPDGTRLLVATIPAAVRDAATGEPVH